MPHPSKFFYLALLCILLLTACPQPPAPSGLSISLEAPSTLVSSHEATLTAMVTGSNNKNVTWSVEGGGSFSDTKANPTIYTAPGVTSETTITIKVTAAADSSKSATKTITIQPPAPLEPVVEPEITPQEDTVPDPKGNPQPVAGSRDDQGVQSDFIEAQALIRPKNQTQLEAFLNRYDATILADNSIPKPPASLGITLTDDQRKPNEFLVQFSLNTIDLSDFAADAAKLGLGGLLEVSSNNGLLTLAGIADALTEGFDVVPNYLAYPSQFPTPLFNTQERPNGAGGFADAFTVNNGFQATGSQSNVTLAWQFIAARGIARRVNVAIIDGGFWLDGNGNPLTAPGDGSDLPQNPIQYDFVGDDYIAGAANPANCTGGSGCPWHGNGSAGVATGLVNNQAAAAGTGGLVANPMLFHTDIRNRAQRNRALRTAVAWGADVINMSFGGDCNLSCRIYDRDHQPINDAINGGSRAVFIASAGNGRDSDGDGTFDGYDVGDPSFVHPCIEDHVICVGALNNNATTRIQYSNFGGGVDIFAPTNIPAMANGASGGNLTSFGGTSASAPFVSGVAAMVKAINPNLNNDEVATLLRNTAHKGTSPVDFYIDAYAAVRAAADGIDGVKDRFEFNDLTPTKLAGLGPWNEANLNFESLRDRDYFRFTVPNRATMTVQLNYPETLGSIPLFQLDAAEACGNPSFISESAIAGGRGKQYSYNVAGGTHVLGVGGKIINAYNLGISFAAGASVPADSYEVNDTPATARALYSFRRSGSGLLLDFMFDARATISASIHTSSDIDYYTLRGVEPTMVERLLFKATPVLKIYGNESPIQVDVFLQNPDGTPGALVASQASAVCSQEGLSIPLEENQSYVVKVSGSAGRYKLDNGTVGERLRLPELVRDRIYIIMHPGEPVEQVIRFPEIYVFPADKIYPELRVKGKVHLQLFDMAGTMIREGATATEFDEVLNLRGLEHNAIYALKMIPDADQQEVPMTLSWDADLPKRSTDNLLRNPGAEEGQGNDGGGDVESVQDWDIFDDLEMPTVVYYNGVLGLPDQESPGPEERGDRFFAGGDDRSFAVLRQANDVPDAYLDAVDNGNVVFHLSAYAGGKDSDLDQAIVQVRFLNQDLQELGNSLQTGPGPAARENKTGLLPLGLEGYVPAGTRYIYTDMVFQRLSDDSYNDAYIDELKLTLSDYTP